MSKPRDPIERIEEEERNVPVARRIKLWLWDLLKTWGPALLTVLVIRSVVAEPFRIPSGSMVPTLEIGDYILVNKFAYGLRFPFTRMELVPLGEPDRGDIVVFQYPQDPSLDYIKRIVGIPGDEILVQNNTLYVNGEPQERTFLEPFEFVDDRCNVEGARLYQEKLGELEHAILNSARTSFQLADFGPVTVPEGEVFVMGDNRDNSSDSRRWGGVPIENIKGKAMVVWLSYDACAGHSIGNLQVGRLRLDRFGTVLH